MSSMRRRSPHYENPNDRVRSNMRMDRKPNATRISDPSHPAGKRKEIDNVMKKARQQPANEYWDKKLLEAEDKDPNRWKHTGYKKMYVNGVRKSRSRSPIRKTPVSPRPRHIPQSPVRRRISRTPERYKPRSPPPRYAREMRDLPRELREPRESRQLIKPKEMYRGGGKGRPISPPPKAARTPSISSCSDDSCSVCSSDDGRRVIDKSRLPERYHGPMNRMVETERVPTKKNKLKALSPKRRHLKRPVSPEKTRRLEPSTPTPAKKKDKTEKARTRVKVEGEKRRRTPSTASEDSTSSGGSFPALTATTRISLSERFGKMAQWNNDRKYDMSNMKITKNTEGTGDRSAVMIQEQQVRESPPMRSFSQYSGEGHFPEELLTQQQASQEIGLGAWDDVRVRFDYYKSKGYLRDLTLADYKRWEEWWYRYQEWLKQERYFEMIERNMMRRRRKKMPIQQRLN